MRKCWSCSSAAPSGQSSPPFPDFGCSSRCSGGTWCTAHSSPQKLLVELLSSSFKQITAVPAEKTEPVPSQALSLPGAQPRPPKSVTAVAGGVQTPPIPCAAPPVLSSPDRCAGGAFHPGWLCLFPQDIHEVPSCTQVTQSNPSFDPTETLLFSQRNNCETKNIPDLPA